MATLTWTSNIVQLFSSFMNLKKHW